MAIKTKVRRRLKGAGMQIRSRFKRAKASASKFNFTSARKMALKKAQEASAKARRLASNKSARTLAVKGAKMKVRSKFKQSKAGAAVRSAKASFNRAGGNTKLLRAKINIQRAANTASGAIKSGTKIAKRRSNQAVTKAKTIKTNMRARRVGQTSRNFAPKSVNSAQAKFNKRSTSKFSNRKLQGGMASTTTAFSNPRRYNVGKAQNNPTSQLQVMGATKNRAQSARMSRSLVGQGMTNLAGTKQGASKNNSFRSPLLESARQNLMYGGKYQSRILERARKAFTGSR